MSLNFSERTVLSTNTLHIKTQNGGYGSAWLHFPPDEPQKAYLFTARHCLFGENCTDFIQPVKVDILSCEPIISFSTSDEGCQLLTRMGDAIADDIAILILPKQWFSIFSQEVVAFAKPLSLPFNCQITGFPDAVDGKYKELSTGKQSDTQKNFEAVDGKYKELSGHIQTQRADLPCVFEVLPENDLTTIYSDGTESVKGMSGGGVFVQQSDKAYLVGINVEFSKAFKEVLVVGIECFDQLLKDNQVAGLSISYANSLGLDADKLSALLNISRVELGDRYSPQFNFDLPIAEIFHGLASDDIFLKKVERAFHNLILGISKNKRSYRSQKSYEQYESYFDDRAAWLKDFYQKTDWKAGCKTLTLGAVENLVNEIRNFYDQSNDISSKLHDENYRLKKEQGKENNPYDDPLSDAMYRVREILSAIHHFDNDFLSHKMLDLAVSRCLILRGAAGSGKSHLLADIAIQRKKNGLPSLLILGQKLTQGDVWKQIIEQIGLNCTRDTFLETLNSIGQYMGSRFLLMVDAINEGAGKTLWHNHLAGFIEQVKAYPFIGLVVSVRSTYYDYLVPEQLRKNPSVGHYEHHSFEGHEWEVVQHFCKNFGLESPRFPVLAPEFSNAQFLLLLCKSLKNNGKTIFPSGTNGIAWIYKTFTEGVNRKVLQTPEFAELALSNINFIGKAIAYFTENVVDKEGHRMTEEEAFLVFNKFEYCTKPNLLLVLLNEGVLLRDMSYRYEDSSPKEFIQFSYQLYGDFALARHLLDKYFDHKNPQAAFTEGGRLRRYFQDGFDDKAGIFHAVIVYLAEHYGLEIFEIIPSFEDWVKPNMPINIYKREARRAFLKSLMWRSVEKIDFEKIRKYINKEILWRGFEGSFFTWQLQFATIPNHALNIELLHIHLLDMSMPKRDAWWLEDIHNDYTNEHSTIKRLINWARSPQIKNTDAEVTQLAATTLAWFLVSNNSSLRDNATLALVNLLESKPVVMQAILAKFKDINDPYISERLYAAAYGVALRSSDTEGVAKLAQWVYDHVFKDEQPPVNILLREYAQGIIEWALHQKMAISLDIKFIRPPYKSIIPTFPSKEDIAHVRIEYDSPDFKKDEWGCRAQNAAQNDIEGYSSREDRFDKTFSHAIEAFSVVSFREEEAYKSFKKSLKGEAKTLLELIENSLKMINYQNKRGLIDEKFRITLKQGLPDLVERLIKKLTTTQLETFSKVITPYLKNATAKQTYRKHHIDSEPVGRWLVQRVFELGWTKKLHGKFDGDLLRWSGYGSSEELTTERIGKKYLWIGFYEILARLTDNYYMVRDGWRTTDKLNLYKGTWDMYLRKIDPTLIVEPATKKDDDERESVLEYYNWNIPIKEWLTTTNDLPDVSKIIIQTDKDTPQYEWLNLYTNHHWDEPPPLGEEKYELPNKAIWYQIRSYLVKTSEEEAIVEWLSKQNFINHWMPQVMEHHTLYFQEFFWSEAYKSTLEGREDKQKWSTFRNTRFKGIITTEQFSAGGGSYNLQDGIHIQRPAQYIFEKMDLQYSSEDGKWLNSSGELIAFDPSVKSRKKSALTIRKDVFEAFLKREKLSVVWTILGEKQILGSHVYGGNREDFLIINGAFSLNHGLKLSGKPESYWAKFDR